MMNIYLLKDLSFRNNFLLYILPKPNFWNLEHIPQQEPRNIMKYIYLHIFFLKKAKILSFYKQFSDARDTYRSLLKSLDDADKLDKPKKLKIQKDAQKMLDFFDKAKNGVYNDPNVPMKPEVTLPKIKDKNPKYPAIANCLHFKWVLCMNNAF